MTTLAQDSDFVAVARALFGPQVDLAELAKGIDPADTHIDGTTQPANPAAAQAAKQRKEAGIGLAASSLAGVAGVHALKATGVENAGRKAEYVGDASKIPKAITSIAPSVAKNPARAAGLVGTGLLALHGVELAGDALAVRTQARQLKQNQPGQPQTPVTKALPVRLRPINPQDAAKMVSLKARKPAGSPAVVTKGAVDADVEITKFVPDKQQVFGWANVSTWQGQPVHDRQGDVIHIDELEKAAYDYVLDSRVGGDQHRRTGAGAPIVKFEGSPLHTADVIESMVFTPEKIEKMGLPADFPQGWWIGMQIHDPDVWDLVKSGKRTGFSVHGTGRRTPLEKADDSQRQPQYLTMDEARAAARPARRARLRERGHQAVRPPAVQRQAVDSSAIASLGYQPQTHRLSVEMKSRPGEPYEYKTGRKTAHRVIDAPSKGKAYSAEIRGKAKRVTPGRGYTPADRARLFAHPQKENA